MVELLKVTPEMIKEGLNAKEQGKLRKHTEQRLNAYLLKFMTFMVLSKIFWIFTYVPLLPTNLIKLWLSAWILYPTFKVGDHGISYVLGRASCVPRDE
jgi:hypothetical protein